ncbi:MAG: hypothetical protein ACR2HG_06420 [Pyrinomonadaceae bacterium]
MENINEKDTLPNLETVLNAINGLRQEMTDSINRLRQEMNERFDNVETRLANVEERLTNVENDVSKVKELQFVFENEFDRLLALSYKSLELSHENRADVRIMRKEISAWSHDVRKLERKVA